MDKKTSCRLDSRLCCLATDYGVWPIN